MSDYWERQTWYPDSNGNYLCTSCRTVFKQGKCRDICKCPNCRKELTFIGISATVPRKNASDRKWKEFLRRITLMYKNVLP